MEQSFESFMKQRLAASTAFVFGDALPLQKISASEDPASLFGPKGTIISGVDAVNEANQKTADSFTTGGQNRFEIVHMATDSNLAYWTGIQRSAVMVKESGKLTPMDLRVTELFRLENGTWKLFHRHADRLQEA